jgi:hypothetical protein
MDLQTAFVCSVIIKTQLKSNYRPKNGAVIAFYY